MGGLLWNDRLDLLRRVLRGRREILLRDRQTMPIGSHQPQRGLLVGARERDEQSVQDIPGIVIPDREQCLSDQLQQAGAGERSQPLTVNRRKRWVFTTWKSDNFKVALTRLNGGPMVL